MAERYTRMGGWEVSCPTCGEFHAPSNVCFKAVA